MFSASTKAAYGVPPVPETPDPQFNYVTMLLHGDGTNGAQNNTFLDSSGNGHTITRNGNTTQGSFSPYGSGWSNFFNGSSSTPLNFPDNNGFTFDADFTIEAWVFLSSTSAFQVVTSKWDVGGQEWLLAVDSGGVAEFHWAPYSEGGPAIESSSGAVSANQWTHLAAVRSGSTITLYVNGTSVGTRTNGTAGTNRTTLVTVGYLQYLGGDKLTGYVSNLRIVKGTAVYTATFTPSTTPLTAISGTSLLTCQSNRFVDNSTNNFTASVNGVTVQRFNPFGTSTAYSTSVIGGSGYFPQATTGLAVDNSSCMVFSDNFTIEAWCYQFSTDQKVFCGQLSASNFQIQFNRSGVAGRTGIYNDSVWTTLDCSSSPVNQWFHLAYSRSGSNVYIYLNGVLQGTISVSGTLSFSGVYGGGIGGLAGYWTGGWIGYISSFQSSNIAKYTGSNFTPPTALPTAVSSTTVLANMTNGAIFDNAMINNLETVGDAQISTSVKKYGTGSLAFDGTGDYLAIRSTPNLRFDSGDFTIEAWVYATSLSSYNGIFSQWPDNGGSANNSYVLENVGGDMQFYWVQGTTLYGPLNLGSITNNTWIYFAMCRSGGTLLGFKNGALTATYPISQTLNASSSAVNVGGAVAGGGNWIGYIDDLRITKGYARYVANTSNTTASSIRDNGVVSDFFSATGYGVFNQFTAGQYLLVDFGEIRSITTTTYRNGAGGQWAPTQVLIQSSDNNSTWTTRATYSDNNTTNLQTISSTGSGRYWRIYQNTSTRQAASGYEWHLGSFSMSGSFTSPTQAFSNIGPN